MKYFVTGTGTDVGKTYITKLLCKEKGWSALKPVECGSNDSKILGCQPLYKFKAPLAPNMAAKLEGVEIDFNKIIEFCQKSAANLIEGAGGVMSPITDDKTNLDLIKALGLPVILVCGSYLGSITHTLTALAVLKGMQVEVILSESELEFVGGGVDVRETAKQIENFSGIKPRVVLRS